MFDCEAAALLLLAVAAGAILVGLLSNRQPRGPT